MSPPPEEVQRLIERCRMEKKQLILGCDANAHHKVWGSTDINHRGEDLLDFLFSSNIEIVNVGNSPTFMNAIRREVIDLTLATPFIAGMVKNWGVSEEPSMSDHMAIEFNVEATASADVECRIPRKTDWELYIAHISFDLKGLKYNISSNEDLENASAHFTSCLKRAFENNCPLRKKTISRDVPWWNNHLENLKKTSRKAFNKAKREGSWNAYRLALTNYNKEVRKAKRQSWRSFCEGIDKTAPAARLQKVLSKDHFNPIGQIKPCGEFTNDPQESLKAPLETHFPGSRQITSEDGAPAGEVYNLTRWDSQKAGRLFTPERIEWAIKSFQPFKSACMDGLFPAMLQKDVEVLIDPITELFKASFTRGYIPKSWREARVVFIPKEGRKGSRSLNPIDPYASPPFS
ncbi:uncharacterized protein LOC123675318 [Harmonia axyridis]|uniref:uncharacterized protein LOC123675318 n=1 Tax=Harmonia axyridis TaxID=115357 RepID=UPI001E279BEF|nr:uncharacterized protein LOC123675318 [Harmonia axyridis]